VIDEPLALTIPTALVEAIAQRVAELLLPQETTATWADSRSPWLTFEQAREYLGFSRDTLYKLTAAKAIPCRKKQGGQKLRFHRDELDQWMRDRYPRVDRAG
jgi:excisionase family DNA binding protein